jgi:hypothetical protein
MSLPPPPTSLSLLLPRQADHPLLRPSRSATMTRGFRDNKDSLVAGEGIAARKRSPIGQLLRVAVLSVGAERRLRCGCSVRHCYLMNMWGTWRLLGIFWRRCRCTQSIMHSRTSVDVESSQRMQNRAAHMTSRHELIPATQRTASKIVNDHHAVIMLTAGPRRPVLRLQASPQRSGQDMALLIGRARRIALC